MTELPIVDPAAIERLREWGGVSLPGKLIDVFLSQAPERMEQIREGVATGAPAMAEGGAHSLKSSAGNVGAARLQRAALEVEELAREGKREALQERLPELEAVFADACTELRRLLEGLTA